MKQLPSKHASHEKEHHNFISLITLILLSSGLLFLLYLLTFCHLSDRESTPLICHASAREKEQAEGKNQISEAVFLSRNAIHQITLSPYSHRYYYVAFQENDTLNILSGSASIRVTFCSQNGNQLRFPKKDHKYHFEKISGDALSPGDRIFLKFASTSTKTCTIKVQYQKSSAKNAEKKITVTPKPKKGISRRKSARTKRKTEIQTPSSKPKGTTHASPKPSTISKRPSRTTPEPSPKATKKVLTSALAVKPHFLRLATGTKKELSLSLGKSPLSLSDCTYFLTDSSLLSIQGNTLFGKKEGITVLYFRTNKSATRGSCLIRVTKN